MILNKRHTGIVVNDLEKSINFYEGLGLKLKLRIIEEGDYIDNLVSIKNVKLEWAKLVLPDNSMIELLKYHSHQDSIKSSYKQKANKMGCSHMAFTVTNIKETIDYICSNGGSINSNFQSSPDGNVLVVYCYDTEGNILEIVEEIK